MYGTSCEDYDTCYENLISSFIKTKVDDWFDENLNEPQYISKLSSEAIYCNDRDLQTGDYLPNYNEKKFFTGYRADHATPQFLCTNPNDKFTGTNINNVGNQNLGTKPIALLTSDEIMYAGAFLNTYNDTYYLNQNSIDYDWITLSSYRQPLYGYSNPRYILVLKHQNASSPSVMYGGLVGSKQYQPTTMYFRPTISFKPRVITVSGDGTDAYVIDNPTIDITLNANGGTVQNSLITLEYGDTY